MSKYLYLLYHTNSNTYQVIKTISNEKANSQDCISFDILDEPSMYILYINTSISSMMYTPYKDVSYELVNIIYKIERQFK